MSSCQLTTLLMPLILLCSFTGCGSERVKGSQDAETQLNWYPDSPSDVAIFEPREKPAASERGPWPVLAVEQGEHSFGSMQTEESGSHVFLIANQGKSELEIAVGRPSSNIKNVTLSSGVVEPGETVSVRLEWFSGRGETEQFIHGVEIYTNDPKALSQQLVIEGKVVSAHEQG